MAKLEEAKDLLIMNKMMIDEQAGKSSSRSTKSDSDYDFEVPGAVDDIEEMDDEDPMFEVEYQMADYITKSDLMTIKLDNPENFLTEAESNLLALCTDPLLKEAAVLNRKKNLQLIHCRRQIKMLLEECQENIEQYQNIIVPKSSTLGFLRLWRIGAPFFKTADDFPCPRNPDHVRKEEKGELLFYDLTSNIKWIPRDVIRLKKWVSFHYKINKETELINQINELKKDDPKKVEIRNNLELQLEKLKKDKSAMYPALGCEHVLAWKEAEKLFNRASRHSAEECKNVWINHLHPDINSGAWTSEEDKKLKELAKEFKYQNWEEIAKRLGTKRTAFLACRHFFRTQKPVKGGRFSREEDEMLLQLVNKYKQPFKEGTKIPWSKIAAIFLSRSRDQLFFRYTYYLCNYNEENKDGFYRKFTQAEDLLLMILVDKFGNKFTQIANYFPRRTSMALKSRHCAYLSKPCTKKGSFTPEEDKQILDYVAENGFGEKIQNWGPLASTLNRSSSTLRQRCRYLGKFIKGNNYQDFDFSKVPRRVFHSDPSKGEFFGEDREFLRSIADTFKKFDHIPTLEEAELALKVALEELEERKHPRPVSKTYSRKGQSQISSYQRKSSNIQKPVVYSPIKMKENIFEQEPPIAESEIDLPTDVNSDKSLVNMSTLDMSNLSDDSSFNSNVIENKRKTTVYKERLAFLTATYSQKAVKKVDSNIKKKTDNVGRKKSTISKNSKTTRKKSKTQPTTSPSNTPTTAKKHIKTPETAPTIKPKNKKLYVIKDSIRIKRPLVKTQTLTQKKEEEEEEDQSGQPLAFQSVFIPDPAYLSIEDPEVDPLAVPDSMDKPIEPTEITLPRPQLNSKRKALRPECPSESLKKFKQMEVDEDLKELELMEEFLKKEKESVEEDVFVI